MNSPEASCDLVSVCALYHLIDLIKVCEKNNYSIPDFKDSLKLLCVERNLKGTILVADDGINGTVAGDISDIHYLLNSLAQKLSVNELYEVKYSSCTFVPFSKMKVLIRKEVVSLQSDIELDSNLKAENLNSQEWDQLMEDEEVQMIDARNEFEFNIGTFKGALNPRTVHFRDFKKYLQNAIKNKKLDLNKKTGIFCTGNIRCEKAGVYMKNLGFKNVFKLKGGILRYLEKTKNAKDYWSGDCFVFDDRVTVDSNLNPGKLRCIHCLNLIKTIDERRSITKGRVVCASCEREKAAIHN